jgi:hypothetical protein
MKRRYKTRGSLRCPDTLLLEYRIMEQTHFNINAVLGRPLLPCNALIGQFVIFSQITLIRDWNKLDFYSIYVLAASSSTSMILWIIALEICGQQNSKCKEVMDSWRFIKFQNSSEAKYFYKMRKICPVIHIGILGTFTVKRKTVLTFAKGISRGVFKELLALK